MYKQLTKEVRYYIYHRKANLFESPIKIAKDLKVSISTVYRELKRNTDALNGYDPDIAQVKSELRRYNARTHKRFSKFTNDVVEYITTGLNNEWSPEQISGRMKKDIKISISYKNIYQYIWHDKQNSGLLYKKLPHQGKRYKYGNPNKVKIVNRVDISKRPKIVEKKTRIGDFEGDTIVGARGGSKNCLLTLVDRKSKYTFIRRTFDKSAMSIQTEMEYIYDNNIIPFKTITYDNGTEFCNHQQIAINLGCNIYFARPYKSCDRGLNEHTNGLIRRFFPKKTDFSKITDDEIKSVQNKLNNRPRKSLGFLTPNEVMNKYLNRLYSNKRNTVALQR
jgi:transposase, IS30 family